MFDLMIKNANVVSPQETVRADVAVVDGKIVAVGTLPANATAKRTVNADGKYLLPGVIDAHMHVYAPFQGCIDRNDFFTQSISAACGGVTMFMDFANTYKGDSVFKKVKVRHQEMKISAIDYGIHGKIVEFDEQVAADLKSLIEYGCPTYKLFTIYKKEGVMSSDETMLEIFALSKTYGGLPMLHCESDPIASRNNERFIREGKLGWRSFAQAKPVECETEAFARATTYARYCGSPLIIVHTTNRACLDIARANHQRNAPHYIETCPHYLTLDDTLYDSENGHLAICSPPLRDRAEQDALWEGIADGTISLIGSDDCTYTFSEKSKYLERDENGKLIPDFTVVPGGVSGMEIRLPLLLSEGVSKGRISINRLCAITSAQVARIYGCYPRKGFIGVGSDADMVLVDMEKEAILSQEQLHNNADFCLHEGLPIKGLPVMTISNGEIIVEDGQFKGRRGAGHFIPRRLDPVVTERFAPGGAG